MKKILISLLLMMLIFGGCTNNKEQVAEDIEAADNGKIENVINKMTDDQLEEFEIKKIIVNNKLGAILNNVNSEIEYSYTDESKIEFVFSGQIKDEPYVLGIGLNEFFAQVNNQKDVKKEMFFEYKIDGDKLTILLPENYTEISKDGEPFSANIVTVVIPKDIKSTNDKGLEDDIVVQISRNSIPISQGFRKVNELIRRESKSLVIEKRKDDGIDVYYVAKDTRLFEDDKLAKDIIRLEIGENLIVRGISGDVAEVEVHFPREYTAENFGKDAILGEEVDYKVLIGYVDKNSLYKIPEPMNDRISYYTRLENDRSEKIFLPILVAKSDLVGESSIYLPTVFKEPEKEVWEIVESACLRRIAKEMTGELLYSRWHTNGGDSYDKAYVSYDNKVAHNPQISWTEYEYGLYNKFCEVYYGNIIKYLERFNVYSELDDVKQEVITYFKNMYAVDKAWYDYSFIGELKEGFFFDEIVNNIDVTEDTKTKLKDIFVLDNIDLVVEQYQEKQDSGYVKYADRELINESFGDDLEKMQMSFLNKINILNKEVLNIFGFSNKLGKVMNSMFMDIYDPNQEFAMTVDVAVAGCFINVESKSSYVFENDRGRYMGLKFISGPDFDLYPEQHIRGLVTYVNGMNFVEKGNLANY